MVPFRIDIMVRRRIRVREGSVANRSGIEHLPSSDDSVVAGSDGFALSFSGGRGILVLKDQALAEAVTVEYLEFVIPDIAFPFDISSGVRGLRHRRHLLSRMTVSVPLADLEHRVMCRLQESAWYGETKIGFEKDYISVLTRYGPQGSRIPFSFRLMPSLGGAGLELLVDEPRAYGALPMSLFPASNACIQQLAGIRPSGFGISFTDLVKQILIGVLPGRGWRLPDYQTVRLVRLELLPDRAVLEYRHPDFVESMTDNPFVRGGTAEVERLRRQEERRMVREADSLLAEGENADARLAYGRILERDSDNPLVASRLAGIDVLDSDLRDTARSLAQTILVNHPGRTDLLAILIQGAALADDPVAEEAALAQLGEDNSALERLATGMRRGRLLVDSDPAQAAVAFEGALAARREDREALDALLTAYASLGDRDRVRNLISRWIAVHRQSGERAAAHIRAGEVLLYDLCEPSEAARHFERASLIDPKSDLAAWGLAESLSRCGEIERAIAHFERLERKLNEAGDTTGAARAMIEIGSIWQERGELSIAAGRLREALDLAPGLAQSRVQLARVLLDMSRFAQAASEFETALHRSGDMCREPWWAKAGLELASVYLNELEDPAAAEQWTRTVIENAEDPTEAKAKLVSILTSQKRFDTLAVEFEQELEEAQSVELVLGLASARRDHGDLDGAFDALFNGRKRFPDSSEMSDALIEISRQTGNNEYLRDALSERIGSIASAKRRATMAIELAHLEIEKFDNPSAAIYWFKMVRDQPGMTQEMRRGLNAAFARLCETAEGMRDQGEFDAARILFATVRREADGVVGCAAALGEAETALEIEDFEEALEAATFASGGPQELHFRAAIAGARALTALGKVVEAVGLLEQASEKADEEKAAELIVYATAISPSDFVDRERTRFLLERALSADPDRQDMDEALIKILEASDDRVDLAEYLVRSRGDQLVPARFRRATKIFIEAGQNNRAIEVLTQLFKQTREIDDAYGLTMMLKESRRFNDVAGLLGLEGNSSQIDELLQQELSEIVEILVAKGELESAFSAAECLVRHVDLNGARAARAAELAQQLGRNDRASELWRSAIAKDDRTSWMSQAVVLLDPQKNAEELTELLTSLEQRDGQIESEDQMLIDHSKVDLDFSAGREDEAIERMVEIVGRFPADERSWKRLVAMISRRGNWQELVKQMRQRIESLEDFAIRMEAVLELGQLLEEKLGDEIGAQQAYDRVLAEQPDNQSALRARASLAYRRRKWERLDNYLSLIEPAPDDLEVEQWRAAVADHVERREDAYASYQQLLAGNPTDTEAVEGIGKLTENTDLEGKLSDAFDRFRRK
jgi:tetratricopeptide (TPR) repeat protein